MKSFLFQHELDDPERGMIFVCSATHKTKVNIDVMKKTQHWYFNIFRFLKQ